jgi:hypothetical protein
MSFIGGGQYRSAYDPNESVHKIANLVWDTGTLSWVKSTTSGGGVSTDVNVTNDFLTDAQLRASPVEITQPTYVTRTDSASSTVLYVGYANPGSSPGSAVWQIIRYTTSGNEFYGEYADSNDNFDNVWNNRASLSYG